MNYFNPKRLELARKRRKLTGKLLAEKVGISEVTISRLESAYNEPSPETVQKIADVLGYPVKFFYDPNHEEIARETVSFRSLKRMTAAVRDAALGGGDIGLILANWADKHYNLPKVDLLDLSNETDPEAAAILLRQHWGLGEKPIPHLIKLLEAKGVRVMSFSEDTEVVDAFSFWKGNIPFITLSYVKTAEHSRFDAAHELGHLVLHKHGTRFNKIPCSTTIPKDLSNEKPGDRDLEREADRFASAFLMPQHDVLANIPYTISADNIIRAKARWKVSAMALTYRLHTLKRITDWQYRSLIIELGKRGYRKGEPEGIERETSIVWKQIFNHLWQNKQTKEYVKEQTNLPLDEIEYLMYGLLGQPLDSRDINNKNNNSTPLTVVSSSKP